MRFLQKSHLYGSLYYVVLVSIRGGETAHLKIVPCQPRAHLNKTPFAAIFKGRGPKHSQKHVTVSRRCAAEAEERGSSAACVGAVRRSWALCKSSARAAFALNSRKRPPRLFTGAASSISPVPCSASSTAAARRPLARGVHSASRTYQERGRLLSSIGQQPSHV